MSGVEKVVFAITADFECWMINSCDSQADLQACELFGFGLGSFNEVGTGQIHSMSVFSELVCIISFFPEFRLSNSTGVARNSLDKLLPWMIGRDVDPLIFVSGSTPKKVMCLAELAHFSCQSSGITEFSMIDHDITQMVQACSVLKTNHDIDWYCS